MSVVAAHGLRALVALFILVTVVLGVGLPFLASMIARDDPEFAHLAVPYVIAAESAVLCVLVALLALWMLVSRVMEDRIFDPGALRWVDVIISVTGIASVTTLAVGVHQAGFATPTGNASITAALGLLGLAGVGFALTMVVMRELLRRATRLQTEMAEVI